VTETGSLATFDSLTAAGHSALAGTLKSELPAGAVLARVGQISFANCLPVTLPLERGLVPLNAKLTFAAPSVLNNMFQSQLLDAGAMSSFYYLSQADQLELLPDLSIACTGAVGSVLFFSKRDLRDLTGAKVIGSAQSATSINLLKVLLRTQLSINIELVADEQPDLDRADVDAALVIGDRALEVDEEWSKLYLRVDLGQWWAESQELPMVFGVWAASRQWAEERPDDFSHISEAHIQARDAGLSQYFPSVLEEAQRKTALPATRLEHYYRNELDFRLNAEHKRGLELYRKLCVACGLL
jgi:chorismate dehydratase